MQKLTLVDQRSVALLCLTQRRCLAGVRDDDANREHCISRHVRRLGYELGSVTKSMSDAALKGVSRNKYRESCHMRHLKDMTVVADEMRDALSRAVFPLASQGWSYPSGPSDRFPRVRHRTISIRGVYQKS